MGWVELGWVGLGWVGLGWVGLGWVGLGWVGLGWIGLGWGGLGWGGVGGGVRRVDGGGGGGGERTAWRELTERIWLLLNWSIGQLRRSGEKELRMTSMLCRCWWWFTGGVVGGGWCEIKGWRTQSAPCRSAN